MSEEEMKQEIQKAIDEKSEMFKKLMTTKTILNHAIDLLKGKYYLNGVLVDDEETIRNWLKGEVILYDIVGKAIDFKNYDLSEEIIKVSMVS